MHFSLPFEFARFIPFSLIVQEVTSFAKKMIMMLTLRTFSDLHLVETDSSIGLSLMKRILNGGAHQIIIAIGGLGIGDIRMKKHTSLHLSLRVRIQIWLQTDWP